jgi:FkbM family methyltransferase
VNETFRTTTPGGAEAGATPETLLRLAKAVRSLGADEGLRDRVVALCREAERKFGLHHGDVRETITGPIVDALHAPGMVLRKELADGVVFDFTYRSKIARDFVLSPDAKPDHVWEPQTTRLLLHLARGARHAVIGGGYIGDHAVLVARALQARGGVCHAFEPNPEAAGLMRRNAANNGVTNLVVSELGLWNEDDGHLVLIGNDSHAHPVRAVVSDSTGKIATITLDSYCKTQGIRNLGLLMLDIEGGEQAALEGAAGFLRQPKSEAPAVVFEIHRSYVDWSNGLGKTPLIGLMADAGYQVFAIRDFQSNVPMGDCLIELLPSDAVYLEGPPHGFNMLAVKDDALLDPALFRVCRDKSPKLLLHKSRALHHPTEWLTRLPAWLGGSD